MARFRERLTRRAVTLVELLVVIAILAILVGILLPIIQRMRESAARAQCTNNLMKVGSALNVFLDSTKTFPAGYVTDAADDDNNPGWGWASLILANMEQAAVFAEISFAKSVVSASNDTVRTVQIPSYICPSDASRTPTWPAQKYNDDGTPAEVLCNVASANYLGVFGIGDPGPDGDGLFYRNSAIGLKDILDGTSQTLAVGERDSSLGHATWVGAVAGAKLFPANSASFVLGHTGGMKSPTEPTEVNNFSSRHPGGVNFLFADGHVSFITGSMPANVLRELSTRAGGEVDRAEKR